MSTYANVFLYVYLYSRRELYSAPTEKLQTWHQPKATKVSPKKFADTMGAKSGAQGNCITTEINRQALSGLHQTMPIFSVLSGSNSNCLISDEVYYSKTIPLPRPTSSITVSRLEPSVMDFELLLFYHNKVRKSLSELQSLEKDTMSQNTSLWHQEREIRVTASRVHEILHCTKKETLCENILAKKDLSKIAPIQLGKRLEPMVKNMLRTDYPNYIFRNTGLVVHPDYPFLGASPDGLLYNKDDFMIVEIKCIYNPKHNSLDELINQRRDFCLLQTYPNEYNLNKKHKYYSQIQMQLLCSGIEKCLFVLFFEFGKSLFKEIIEKDTSFWNSEKLQALSEFYFADFLPKYIQVSKRV